MSGRNEGALQAIEAALWIDPLYMTCWYTKAIIEYSSKQYPQAMRSFNEVLTFPIDLDQEMLQNAKAAMQAMQKGGVQAPWNETPWVGRRKARCAVGRDSSRAAYPASTKRSSSTRDWQLRGITSPAL